MWSIPAVRASGHIAARPTRSARTPVTTGTAVRQAGADRDIGIDVSDAVSDSRSDALRLRKLPLEQLPSAPNRAKRISIDVVQRGVRYHHVAPACPDLVGQRLVDAGASGIRRLRVIDQLRLGGEPDQKRASGECQKLAQILHTTSPFFSGPYSPPETAVQGRVY